MPFHLSTSLSGSISGGKLAGDAIAGGEIGLMPPIYIDDTTTTRVEIRDEAGNLVGIDEVTSGPGYTSTTHYDAAMNYLGNDYLDSWGYRSSTRQTTLTDAAGTVTGYHVTSEGSSEGWSYSSTDDYDAEWNLLSSSYSDSAGYTATTTQTISRDAAGSVVRYDMQSSGGDAGYQYRSSTVYDGDWHLLSADYSDSSGYASQSRQTTLTDAGGKVTGYRLESSGGDGSYQYSSEEVFDADYQLLSSTYSDSSGYASTYLQETLKDAAGAITGYVITSTWTDGTNSHTWVQRYDADWNWLGGEGDGKGGGADDDDGGPVILPIVAMSSTDAAAAKLGAATGSDEDAEVTLSSHHLHLGRKELNASLTGADDLRLTGNQADNVLAGNAGDNRINGKGGVDQLFGGTGTDTFVFDKQALQQADTIIDFTAGEDLIALRGKTFKPLFDKDGALAEGVWGTTLRVEADALVFQQGTESITIAVVGSAAGLSAESFVTH